MTFQSGIMALLTSIHCCPEAHDTCKQNKEITYELPNPPEIAHTDLAEFINDCVSRNGCRINTSEPNQVILESFFQKTMFYLMKSRHAIYLNIKVMKIKHSALKKKQSIFLLLGGGGHLVYIEETELYSMRYIRSFY